MKAFLLLIVLVVLVVLWPGCHGHGRGWGVLRGRPGAALFSHHGGRR